MALDPNKKKPIDFSVLPGGINPATVGTKPAPAPLGGLTAADAGQGVGLLGRAGAVMAQIPAVAKRLLVSNAGNAVANAESNFGSGVQSGFTGQAAAAPLPLPAAAKPFAAYNGPLLAPSTAPAPAQAAPAVIPARSPAVPATTAGASAPVGGGAAPLPRPGTAYNDGSGATYTTGDGRQGQLPPGVAVVRQKNGVNAFGATGASVAAASGQPSAPLAMPTFQQPNLTVPGLDLPSVNTSRVSDAERERAALAKSIGGQADRMNFEGLNTRGKRELYAALLGQQTALSRQGGDLAGSAAGQALGAATQAGVATQGQVGDNNRALLNEQGQNARTGMSEQGANARAQLASLTELQKPTQITDTNGNLLSVTGAQAAAVTGPDGKPVQPLQTKVDRPDANTVVTSYTAQKKALDEAAALTGKPADYSSLDNSPLGQAYAQALGGNAGSTRAPSPPQVGTVKNGFRFKGGNPADAKSWEKTN